MEPEQIKNEAKSFWCQNTSKKWGIIVVGMTLISRCEKLEIAITIASCCALGVIAQTLVDWRKHTP